jgi:hypothetical protein
MMPGEEDFGGFARQQSERRDVADRVASQKRRQCARQRKRDRRRKAQPPAFPTDEKSETGETEDQDEAPAHAPDALDDVGNPRAADRVREERRSCERGGEGEEMLATQPKSQNPKPKSQIPTTGQLGFGAWNLGFGIFARVSVRPAWLRAV